MQSNALFYVFFCLFEKQLFFMRNILFVLTLMCSLIFLNDFKITMLKN